MTALLEVNGLSSRYGRIEALHDVSLTVNEGELVALVGSNGAGKTTLMRALSGIQPVFAGSIRFAGSDITRAGPERRVRMGVAQSPEGRQVFGPLTVADNIRLGAFHRADPDGIAEDTEMVYGRFPILREKAHLPAASLSGGQQQMLAIARTLMSRPRLLLLDEPSMGLAPLLVSEVFSIITDLRANGATIFVVEQNAMAALSIADRGYVLETGKVTLSGSGSELLSDNRVKQSYLGI